MSDTAVTSALDKASEIAKLNGPDDWIEWNRKLRGHLGMVDLWATLTGDAPEPATETPEHRYIMEEPSAKTCFTPLAYKWSLSTILD